MSLAVTTLCSMNALKSPLSTDSLRFSGVRVCQDRTAAAEAAAGMEGNLIPSKLRKRTALPAEVDEALDNEDAPRARKKKTSRLTAADVWDLGPITGGQGFKLIMEKDAALESKVAKKVESQRLREREAGERAAAYATVATAAEEELREGADISSLTVNKLKALLSVRKALNGYATCLKPALVDRLVDVMQGNVIIAPAENTPAENTPAEGTPSVENNNPSTRTEVAAEPGDASDESTSSSDSDDSIPVDYESSSSSETESDELN